MFFIPAYLYITKPKIHSIDQKGRATMAIRLLTMDHQDAPRALTITKAYRKYKQDLIIMINPVPISKHTFRLENIVGNANDIRTWEKILHRRVGLPSPKDHHYLPLRHFQTLQASPQSPRTISERQRKFLLVDKPGTVDREDGIWYDSDEDFGVFTLDLPTQLGWTNSITSCATTLINQWKQYKDSILFTSDSIVTKSQYLPDFRYSMLNPKSYHCITSETLDEYQQIPILCYHWKTHETFCATIFKSQSVTFLDSTTELAKYPDWFLKSPLKDTTVADWNVTMNLQWFKAPSISKNLRIKQVLSRHHPHKNSTYVPITSPVRSLIDLWNQCNLHDMIVKHREGPIYANSKIMSDISTHCLRDINISKFIKLHSSGIQLYNIISTKYKDSDSIPIFEGRIDHFYQKKGMFVSLLIGTNESQFPTIYLSYTKYPEIEPILKKVGDTIRIRCKIQKHYDPLYRFIPHPLIPEPKPLPDVSLTPVSS